MVFRDETAFIVGKLLRLELAEAEVQQFFCIGIMRLVTI